MPRNALYQDKAFQKLKSGAFKLADAVTSTLGPRGKNVLIETGELPIITKDGVTVARYFDLEDPVERMGARIVRQSSSKTNDSVGDGTTTATLLAREIITACEKELNSNPDKDVHELVREMKEYADKISDFISINSVKVKSLEDLTHVATISANNDQETGTLVAELVHKIGKDGVVTVEESSGTRTETEHVEGTQVPNGYASPYMANNEKGECVLNDVPVLVTDRRLSSSTDATSLLQVVLEMGKKKLLIIADEVEGDALATFVVNKANPNQNFRVETLAIKAPLYGNYRQDSLRDLAALVGATFISDEAGRKLDSVKAEDLGSVRKVVATKDKTTMIGGKSNKDLVQSRVEELKKSIEEEKNDFDREKKKERLARLTSGIALIRVGGYTESEMKEKKYLIEDAVCATKAALEDGIVPGGGSALLRASMEVESSFISQCLESPLRTISENAGGKEVVTKVKKMLAKSPTSGYDAKKEEYVEDMIKHGIVDPSKVVKNTLQNAVSVACTFLTTDCVLFDKPALKK